LALLRQLALIGEDDLRLPLVIADLARHAYPLAEKRGFRGPEIGAVLAVDDCGEDRVGVRLPEAQ